MSNYGGWLISVCAGVVLLIGWGALIVFLIMHARRADDAYGLGEGKE